MTYGGDLGRHNVTYEGDTLKAEEEFLKSNQDEQLDKLHGNDEVPIMY